jgi:mRNA interferase RelE/StbE
MALNFSILYHELVVEKDIPGLPSAWREKIKRTVESRLTTQPEVYGKPLRRSLKGYRKLRVGDYRVIFKIEGRTVKILVIQHRSVVYRMIQKRI